MTIGEKIRNCREKKGLSAERLAECLNLSPSTIYRYENGDIDKMPARLLVPLAELLSTTPAYLLGWQEQSVSEERYTSDESKIIMVYRNLLPHGRKLLQDRAQELSILYGISGNNDD